jgi:hypothetical protein
VPLSKPLPATLDFQKTILALKTVSAVESGQQLNKTKLLQQQMREKAKGALVAATTEKPAMEAPQLASPMVQAMSKPVVADPVVSKSAVQEMLTLPADPIVLKSAEKAMPGSVKPDRSNTVETKAAAPITQSDVLGKTLAPRSQPCDNYDMSDEGECDSDSDNEDHRAKKSIPDWARPVLLRDVLQKQIHHPQLDPDEYFGEVESCDLEAVFGKKSQRYARRTSSGNWTQDRVTAHEKLAYKRKTNRFVRPA